MLSLNTSNNYYEIIAEVRSFIVVKTVEQSDKLYIKYL